jgi:hypothetical protein
MHSARPDDGVLSSIICCRILAFSQNIAVDTQVHVSAYADESDQERI